MKSFDEKKVRAKAKTEESIVKTIISRNLSPVENEPCRAREAPAKEAIMAWLSLEGIPKYQATTPKMIIEAKEAQNAHMPKEPSNPASEKIHSATEEFTTEMIKTPPKLHTAESRQALFIETAPEQTDDAMAFGASVKPFTKMTPRESKSAKTPQGVSKIPEKELKNITPPKARTDT